jgi:arylsulfatase A-like enzyme
MSARHAIAVGLRSNWIRILWLASLFGLALSLGGHISRQERATRYFLLEHLDDAEVAPFAGRVIAGPATVGGVERPALISELPSEVRFPAITIRPSAHLRFGVGEDAERQPRAVAQLSVQLSDASGAPVVVWSVTLDPAVPAPHWRDVDIDLGGYAGRSLAVALKAAAGNGVEGRVAWSTPVVSAVAAEPADVVLRRVVVRDLMGATSPPIDLGTFIGYGRVLQGSPARVGQGRIALAEGPHARAAPADASRLHVSVDVPESASLELGAEVLRRSGAPQDHSRPVVFTARVDGATVLSISVDPRSAPATFSRFVPLHCRVGAKVTVDLETSVADGKTLAWWTKAWLLQTRPVARRVHGDGANLLLVVVDTLRADHLGLYGSVRPTSPNLDRFAAGATIFERAMSSSSWTQPAVATLLTGLSPMEHAVTGGVALPADIETLAESMQARGLTTAALSANPIVGAREGFHRGFETFLQLPWARALTLNQAFEEWLGAKDDRPWFAYLHYIDPHDPYNAPSPLGDVFIGNLRSVVHDKPIELLHARNFGRADVPLTDQDLELLRTRYDGEIHYWDNALGELLRALAKRGDLERTVVIVMADHGEEFLDHGKLFHGFHLYEESVRVPLVIRARGLLPPGRQQNVFETSRVKDLAERFVDGKEVRLGGAVVDLDSAPSAGHDLAFAHTNLAFTTDTAHYRSLACATDARWKYILRLDDGNAELYDLARDPAEREDRVRSEPALRERYHGALLDWLAKNKRRSDRNWIEPGMIERLRALGYVR